MSRALTLAVAFLLAGCTSAEPALEHSAAHPASAQAEAAPHDAHGDALPEAVAVSAPSGIPAAHGGHAAHGDHNQMDHSQMDHGQMDHGAHGGHGAHGDPVDLPAEAQRAVREALDAYLAIGDRLAGDSTEGVAEQARTLEAAAARLAEVPALHGHAGHLAAVRAHAAHLAHARDLADARAAFGEIGPAFAHLVAAAGVPEGMELTRYTCGMAAAPEGGVWLQRSGEPRNPYFGTAMLRCHRGQEAL